MGGDFSAMRVAAFCDPKGSWGLLAQALGGSWDLVGYLPVGRV